MVATALAVAALAAAGCGSDDDSAAEAPTTTEAPATTAPATTAPETTPTAPAAPAKPGNAATGKQVFVAASCAGCHKGLGTKPGYGPKLAGKGLAEATIRTTVIEGGSLMPGGLVEGQELADVVAYVSSLQ